MSCQTFNCPGVATCPFEPLRKACRPGLTYTAEQLARFRVNHPTEIPPPMGWGADFGARRGARPTS